MGYKDKVLKKRLFTKSLAVLTDFAYCEPQLSLNNRRAIVVAITLGGSAGCSLTKKLIPELAEKSHRLTQNGLVKAFSEKLNPSHPDLADAIMKLSSLSAWAYAYQNQSEDVMDSFVMKMVPEDTAGITISPARSVSSALRLDWGRSKTLDLIHLSPELWARKYHQR